MKSPTPPSAAGGLIGIAGTGRMAMAIGALLARCGLPVAAVGGRRIEAARKAAQFTGAGVAVAIQDLPHHSKHLLIAVSDDAIAQVADELAQSGFAGGVALHTSGSAGPEALAVLRAAGNSIGVLHPLQTVPNPQRGIETLPGSTFAYAGDAEACEWARKLIAGIGGNPLPVRAERWQHYHAAAVMASNYHVTLVDMALELMEIAGVSRAPALGALAPLIRATTENILASTPEAALTGPIRRGDVGTIQRHLSALKAMAEIRTLYVLAGLRTVDLAQRAGLGGEAAHQVRAALEEIDRQ